jgi:hypothetical protein
MKGDPACSDEYGAESVLDLSSEVFTDKSSISDYQEVSSVKMSLLGKLSGLQTN